MCGSLDAMKIVARIDSVILVKFAALDRHDLISSLPFDDLLFILANLSITSPVCVVYTVTYFKIIKSCSI